MHSTLAYRRLSLRLSSVPVWYVVLVLAPHVCAFWGASTAERPVISASVTSGGMLFTHWESEDDDAEPDAPPECVWWNGSYFYDPNACSHFAVSRMAAASASKGVQRARRCASAWTTDCVLSGEIGLSLPAAFVYDNAEGMRMLIAPRVSAAPNASVKAVRMQDPAGAHPNQLLEYNDTVDVEYLETSGRTIRSTRLHGNDAYCLQTLRRAIVPTCWDALD